MAVENAVWRVLISTRRATFGLFAASFNTYFAAISHIVDGDIRPYLLNYNTNHVTEEQQSFNSNVLDDVVVWMAAPKKRTSRKTKWLRHQRKFLKNREDIETCHICGNAKLMGHVCGTCFERIQKESEPEEVLKN